ncbi:hypothetical protein GCM10028778_13420 [Barrientosiimonas marina]|uniref:Uncharacterized protein n=1 Tax=Lentibacillus kimchii TaxID=1542911 RepID=A0ABW2UVK8_9BACI
MYRNNIARLLFAIGTAHMIAGLIIGLISTAMNVFYTGSGWSNFFVWTAGGFIAGMLFIGFAENIRLLQQINHKLGPDTNRQEVSQYIADSNITKNLDEAIKASIYDHYPDETIVAIVPSPKDDYFLVHFQDGQEDYVRVVYTGGSEVEETNDSSIRQSVIQWYNSRNS